MAQMAGQLWEAPAMERREFVSWDDFFDYMKEYQQRTHQSFSRRSATSVKTRNQVLAAMAKSGRPIPSPLLPESFLDYTRMLQCSHKLRGDAARTHARWNGEQPSECQARINATLQLGDYGKYFIRTTKVSLLHNHPVGADARPVSVAAVQTATSSAVTSGQEDPSLAAKRRRVETQRRPDERKEDASSHADRQTAKEAQQRVPTMADVRMFLERVEISRSNQPGAGQSVEERLAAYVNEFAAQEGNAAKIFVDNEKVLSSVTLQTKHMRQVFEAFPEVLRVDAMPPTSGSSESSYRVFSLMAHDTLGQWQFVQHAIVENDRSETLRVALDQFKAHNPRHTRVRALILPSGDSNQLKELRASFPAARVLYSQFHVLRSLHKVIAEHGDLSSWHRDRLTGIAQLLVYAPTSLVYAANIAVMVDVLGSKQHSFFRYFLEKWDVCRDRWSTFAREGVTTFSMSENDGPFAPTWNAIFAAVNDEMALDETVAAIRYYQTVVERAFVRELNFQVNNSGVNPRVAGSNSGEDYDAEMRLLAATVGPAASSLIFPQYRYAVTRGAYQFCEPSRGSFFISTVSPNDIFCDEPSKEFCVEVDRGWQCSCAFMVNHHLPCRHVFYIRRIVRCSTVIPLENLEPRWVLAKARDFFNSSQVSESAGDSLTGPDTERGNAAAPPPGAWQKFVTAQEVGKRIGYRMMEMEPEEFDRALRFYKLVETTMSVRPFDLNAGIAARINSQNGGLARAAAQKPNWVEPDPTRTLAPRSVPAGVAGTVYVSSNDRMAAAVTARNMQQAQMAQRYRRPSASKTKEVIDLQDESEEEEKAEESTESGRRVEAEQSEGNQEDNNVEPSEADSTTDRPSDKQDANEKAAVPTSNQDEDEDEDARPEQDPSSGDEAVHSTPRIREPWEVIDELEKDQDDEEEGDNNNNDRLL